MGIEKSTQFPDTHSLVSGFEGASILWFCGCCGAVSRLHGIFVSLVFYGAIVRLFIDLPIKCA